MLKTLLVVLALAAGALADSFVFFDGDEPELDDPFDLRQLTVTIVGGVLRFEFEMRGAVILRDSDAAPSVAGLRLVLLKIDLDHSEDTGHTTATHDGDGIAAIRGVDRSIHVQVDLNSGNNVLQFGPTGSLQIERPSLVPQVFGNVLRIDLPHVYLDGDGSFRFLAAVSATNVSGPHPDQADAVYGSIDEPAASWLISGALALLICARRYPLVGSLKRRAGRTRKAAP